MVQNHMLQLLCLVAMEPPVSMDADAVRDEKLKVLKALVPMDEKTTPHLTVRGQYRAGASSGGAVAGYLDELGSPESETETFVALKAEIANWRWAGVPFYLRTGKRLASRVSEIVVAFRPIPHSVFDNQAGRSWPIVCHPPAAGRGREAVADDQGPRPGRHAPAVCAAGHELRRGLRGAQSDAYERLLMDVVRGNQTLFMRRDEVEAPGSGSTRSWTPGAPRANRPSPTPPAPGAPPPPSPSSSATAGPGWTTEASACCQGASAPRQSAFARRQGLLRPVCSLLHWRPS